MRFDASKRIETTARRGQTQNLQGQQAPLLAIHAHCTPADPETYA